MEPTSAEIKEFQLEHSAMAVCKWAGFDQNGVSEYFDLLGFELSPTIKPRLLAMLSEEKHEKLMDKWKIGGEDAKPCIIMIATLVHKTARSVCGIKDEQPLALTGPPSMFTTKLAVLHLQPRWPPRQGRSKRLR